MPLLCKCCSAASSLRWCGKGKNSFQVVSSPKIGFKPIGFTMSFTGWYKGIYITRSRFEHDNATLNSQVFFWWLASHSSKKFQAWFLTVAVWCDKKQRCSLLNTHTQTHHKHLLQPAKTLSNQLKKLAKINICPKIVAFRKLTYDSGKVKLLESKVFHV